MRCASKPPMTLGEKVDRDGPCELFVTVADLAKAVGRIPVGEWAYGAFRTDDRYRLFVNGGASEQWTPDWAMPIPRFHAYIEYHGWPGALVNPGGGSCTIPEDALIDAVRREITEVTRLKSAAELRA